MEKAPSTGNGRDATERELRAQAQAIRAACPSCRYHSGLPCDACIQAVCKLLAARWPVVAADKPAAPASAPAPAPAPAASKPKGTT